MSHTPTWTVQEHQRHVHTLDFGNMPVDETRSALVMSDEHWDNAHCDRSLLKRHHDEAVARGAPILKIGDLFCAMQGKWDRRADQSQLRPEHRGNDYLDRLVESAVKWYRPYRQNLALITPGNHETSITDRHQTDLIERLCQGLNPDSAAPLVRRGGYWGFMEFKAQLHGRGTSVVLHYHHGYGGGGEVTRGMIDNNRTRGQYDADVFYSGHIHRRNMDENVITRLSRHTIVKHRQLFLRGGCYKHDEGWHQQQGRAARPLGGWWLDFSWVMVNQKNRTFQLTCSAKAAD